METGYHSSANLPRACPQHLRTKPGSVAHGNLFFGSGANLNDGYPRPCHVRRHRNPAHFTSGWIRVCALLRLELTTSECHGALSHYRFFYQRTKPTQCFLKSTPELRPLTPSAQNPAREPLTPRMGYPMRFITAVGAWFACGSLPSIVVGSGRSSSSASPEPLIASPRRLSVCSTVSPSRVVKLSVLRPR